MPDVELNEQAAFSSSVLPDDTASQCFASTYALVDKDIFIPFDEFLKLAITVLGSNG